MVDGGEVQVVDRIIAEYGRWVEGAARETVLRWVHQRPGDAESSGSR